MESDILHEVVAAETEIQREIEIEKKRAEEWLSNVRKEAGQDVAREKERFEESCAVALAEAKGDAERAAATISGEASERAAVIQGLDSELLRRIVMRHIIRILPGEYHDRQDVEG